METVAIIGVGLIGGSFGLAIRDAGFTGRIVGVSSPKTIHTAMERGAIDEGAGFAEAVSQADLVLLAAPIFAILEHLDSIDQYAKPGSLITDAGSTKRVICDRAKAAVRRAAFVGGHPMAGKERSGIGEAEAGLFRNRPWVICSETLQTALISEFLDWVQKIGARPVMMSAENHDKSVAFTSHLPQLISTALAASIDNLQQSERLTGPGILDMTRLAASPHRIWRDILVTNEDAIRAALAVFLGQLEELSENFESRSSERVFETAERVSNTIRCVLPR